MRRMALATIVLLACTRADSQPVRAPKSRAIDDGPAPTIDGDHSLVRNGDFADGAMSPWRVSLHGGARGKAGVDDGALCLDLDAAGTVAWDAQLRHRALVLRSGHDYVIDLVAWSDRPVRARPRIGRSGPPYEEYWASEIELGPGKQRFRGHFRKRSSDDDGAELAIQLGGPLPGKGAAKICIDDVALSDPQFEPPPPPAWMTAPRIRVNQVGYFPQRPKHATWKTGATEAAHWVLRDADGKAVAEGETTVLGEDRASGDHVHDIDFGAHTTAGRGYTLEVGKDRSDAFAIADDIYASLRKDAMAYFHHNRSGIAIETPHVDAKWARGAGHPGDAKVECLPDLECKGTFDASGGWYDAGDHGKYPVPAGITLWTLMNAYEWATVRGDDRGFGDGTLAIPERDNGAPDLLDEARWELEMLMRLQTPSGKWAGMVFHKLHEKEWAPIPTAPDKATAPRFLHRPSTAATLDTAAVLAQAARVFRASSPSFADRCLAAAERAWAAAQKHPDLFAPGDDSTGGGAYPDGDVADERYWAAVELFVTTGKPAYRKALASSRHFLKMPGPGADQGGAAAPMTWAEVHALGTITLASVPNELGAAEIAKAKARVVATARAIVEVTKTQGYRVPLRPDGGGGLPWGSNSAVLNNMITCAIAFELTGEDSFRAAAIDGMDYLLGRNPMGISYVTGYGARATKNVHHRFWAHSKDATFPPPPPGAVAGGPNSAAQDPAAKAAGLAGGPPLKAYIDDIESWSTNEVAINWNAPLAWASAWLDVRGREK